MTHQLPFEGIGPEIREQIKLRASVITDRIERGEIPRYQFMTYIYNSLFEQRSNGYAEGQAATRREFEAVERRYRALMWLSHGHRGVYGDDGEMQCGECARFGCWDYKCAPLEQVEAAFNAAKLEGMAAALSSPSQESSDPPEDRRCSCARRADGRRVRDPHCDTHGEFPPALPPTREDRR